MVQIQHAKADDHPQPNVVAEPPKRNRFYALNGREELEKSTDVDNGNLFVFSFPVYALLDPGSTFSMVTPFVANRLDILPEILHELFLVSTPIGDNIKSEGVCREVDGIVAGPFQIKLGVIRFNLRPTRCYLRG